MNGSGSVDLDEFLALMEREYPCFNAVEDLRPVFRVLGGGQEVMHIEKIREEE